MEYAYQDWCIGRLAEVLEQERDGGGLLYKLGEAVESMARGSEVFCAPAARRRMGNVIFTRNPACRIHGMIRISTKAPVCNGRSVHTMISVDLLNGMGSGRIHQPFGPFF